MSKFAFDRKLNDDGTPNKKYVDLLDEDKPISGQKFVCVSFVSPENILSEKKHFFFQKFLEDFEITKSIEKYSQFLNFLSYKYDMNFDDVMNDFQEFIKSEKSSFTYNDVKDAYRTLFPNAISHPGYTWTPNPFRPSKETSDRIDYIFFKGPLDILTSSVHDGPVGENPWPSDHRAVTATFSL